jgi:tetratricopeptide (TPR) repeat protein
MDKIFGLLLRLSVILIWLLAGCAGKKEDPRKFQNPHAEANESLKKELRAFESFNKAEPFYQSGLAGADSAIFHYGQLLHQDLNPNHQLMIYNRVGYWKYIQQEYSDSYSYFRKAIGLLDRVSPDHIHMEGMAFYYAGLIQSDLNQSDSAFYYFNEGRNLFRRTGDPDNLFNFLCLEGIANEYNWGLKDYVSAENYYTQAERMLETGRINGIDSYRFGLFYSIASTYRQKREFDKAMAYAVRARNLADSLYLPASMEISRSLLSNIYRDQNLWEPAESLNLQAIEINRSENGAMIDRANYFNNQSFILINLRQYDEAMAYCEKTLEVLDTILTYTGFNSGVFKNPATHADLIRYVSIAGEPGLLLLALEQLGVCYDFRGTICRETGNPANAYRDYLESLRIRLLRYGTHHKRVAQINHLIGGLCIENNLPDSALFYYQQSLIAGCDGFSNTDPLTGPGVEQMLNNVELIEVLRDKASLLKLIHGKDPRNKAILRASLDCYLLCDSLIDFVWSTYANEESQLYLENIVQPVYEQAIETAWQYLPK